MSDWQYQQGNSNPFAEKMLQAGLPEYSKGPRLAFYGDDASVSAAGFPLDNPNSYTSPVTGKHQAWVPDDGYEMKDTNATSGVFGDFVKHPNLRKVYPDAMNVPTSTKQLAGMGGAYTKDGKILINKNNKEPGPVGMHEMQHWINDKTGNVAPTQESGVYDRLFGGRKAYWNSEEEAMARFTESNIARLIDGAAPSREVGLDAIRNDMIDRTGSKKFFLEK